MEFGSPRLKENSIRKEEEELQEAAKFILNLKKTPEENSLSFSTKRGRVDPFDSLTSLLRSIYGDDAIESWKKTHDVREIWELSSPKTQCMNVIGPPTMCWICGGGFKKEVPALVPECEHILPVAQAVFFLDLYATEKKKAGVPMDGIAKDIFRLEYEWAHSICNRIKSDSILVKYLTAKDGSISEMKVDSVGVGKLLREIQSSVQEKNILELKPIVSAIPWIFNRTNAISERLQQVVNFINGPISRKEGNLQLLAQTSSYVDSTNISPKFAKLLGSPLPAKVLDTPKPKNLQTARRTLKFDKKRNKTFKQKTSTK